MKKLLAVAYIAFFASTAQADFVDTDWKNEGDAKVTLDTETGIEWLKLENTADLSYSELQSEMAAGGQFDGWRMPTVTEIRELIYSVTVHSQLLANINTENYRVNIGYNSDWAKNWRQIMGLSYYKPRDRSLAFGVSLDDDGNFILFGNARLHTNNTQSFFINWTQPANYADNERYSFFLVSDGGDTLSSINDPTLNVNNPNSPARQVPIAFAPGLLGLFLVFRRRSKRPDA